MRTETKMAPTVSTHDDQPAIQAADLLAKQNIIAAAKQGAISSSETQFVYFAAFDGTNNDAQNAGNFQTTNVKALADQVQAVAGATLYVAYFAGLGAGSRVIISPSGVGHCSKLGT